MTPIVTIRPAPGDAATVALGRELGLTIASFPLFEVGPLKWHLPDPAGFHAVLLGSANALRHGGPGLASLITLPALCVGEATARAAEQAGFTVTHVGKGGLQSVLAIATANGWSRLLRLSGEAHVPLDLPAGTTLDTRTLYRVNALPIGAAFTETLRKGAVVLLHSGEAAAHFANEVDRLNIPRQSIAITCLAPRIAERAGGGWRALSTASQPDDRALLAMALQMCQA
ncbi:uroporphyrinogen-III synthase [Croceicoccus naphthovorans]|uniref:Uncharacterized protein n=1 Tax=Croceicoccus naphthovorans TaxID=1348774 RepID=A0A0G3XG18_9SPHN|nr:uroporphyrinogen-III synthase [Croceicoccus naphthovorans]AKM09338.1 hypothetical protein AB433_04035 [Croceicoccus naphthovorans]MBB3990250.1 uroporphyrinogen-III synthase [Croceicoccus naphthovorans]